jgi:hypothetical protein
MGDTAVSAIHPLILANARGSKIGMEGVHAALGPPPARIEMMLRDNAVALRWPANDGQIS